MWEFHEYRDGELLMRMPSYLRPKKGVRYFSPHRQKDKDREIFAIAVEIGDKRMSDVYHDIMLRGSVAPTEWMGVTSEVIRRGESKLLYGAIEVLVRSYNRLTEDVILGYEVIFERKGKYVHISIHGRRDLRLFEKLCNEIILSFDLNG